MGEQYDSSHNIQWTQSAFDPEEMVLAIEAEEHAKEEEEKVPTTSNLLRPLTDIMTIPFNYPVM